MNNSKIIQDALRLKPQERYLVVESLLESLDIPDDAVDSTAANMRQIIYGLILIGVIVWQEKREKLRA